MNSLPKLWGFKKGQRVIYFLIGKIKCSGCQKSLGFGSEANHLMNWHKSQLGEFIYCEDCLRKGIQPLGVIPPNWNTQERRKAIVVEDVNGLPAGSFPIQLVYHGLTDGKGISTFAAANNEIAQAERVIDKTKLAGRADSTFIEDNAPVVKGILTEGEIMALDNRRKESVDEVLKYLETIAR